MAELTRSDWAWPRGHCQRLPRCVVLLMLLAILSVTALGLNIADEVIIRWPDPDGGAIARLKELGAGVVVVPDAGGAAPEKVAAGLSRAGLVPTAEIPAAELPEFLSQVRLAREAGFQGVVFAAFETEELTRQAIRICGGLECFVSLTPEQINWNVSPAHAVLRHGQWPGVHPGDPASAGATTAPWIDANSYLVSFLRANHPDRTAWLGYLPDEAAGVSPDRMLSFHSVELALAEAFAAGGNVILSLPERFRRGLAEERPAAVEAWNALVITSRFLREHRGSMSQPVASQVAVAVSNLEDHGEILNMLFRRNVSPVSVSVETRVLPAGVKVFVAAGAPSMAGVAIPFVRGGGRVLAAPGMEDATQWWLVGGATETAARDGVKTYRLGAGEIAAYPEPIYDPAEFALDVIEATGRDRRDVRLWGPETVVGILHRQPRGATLELINYGATANHFLVRVEGMYDGATLLRPEAEAANLESRRRNSGTEIEVPELRRFARLVLK